MGAMTGAEGCPSIFLLNYVQSGNDSQALRSARFLLQEPGQGCGGGDENAGSSASPSACPAEPSVLDGVVNFFLLCFFTMGEGGGSRLRGLRSPDGVQS